jgi:hypothetical protein
MPQTQTTPATRRPWNSGRIIGPKPPPRPKHIWATRQQLKNTHRVRDLWESGPLRSGRERSLPP